MHAGPTLVLLYGPPAVGKLSVAREVAALTGFRVLRNHLVNAAAREVLDDDSPRFWELVWAVRTTLLRVAALEGVDLVLTYAHVPGDEQRTEGFAALYEGAGGRACFVRLVASREALLRRVTSPSRRTADKICEPAQLAALMHEHDLFQPLAGRTSLTIDTEQLSPPLAAERIVTALGLPRC